MDVDGIAQKSSVHEYYVQKIEELQLIVNEKGQNLRRLQAQRNELNAKGKTINLILRFYFWRVKTLSLFQFACCEKNFNFYKNKVLTLARL